MTRPAPSGFPSWTARLPTPPAPDTTTTLSPSSSFAQVRYRCQAVRPWISSASGAVVHAVGDRERGRPVGHRVLGVAAGPQHRHHAGALREVARAPLHHARDLAPGD